jgi:myo-inositol-1(or 4)-monophosphatase
LKNAPNASSTSDPAPSPATLNRWLATARAAAAAAAAVHTRWGGGVSADAVRRKGDGELADFVSHVDEEAQEAALTVITQRHPDHAILAEEGEAGGDGRASPTLDGPCWIVDPLDGTTNFLHGMPVYAASVGLALEGRAVAGAVMCAPTGEAWWARRGGGAWKNGRPVRVSAVTSLRDALVGSGFPFKAPEFAETYARQLVRVVAASSGVRRAGAAALDLCWLAEGRFDAFWELLLEPWDFTAGAIIVAEAGGCLDRVEATPGAALPLASGSVLAANTPEQLAALRTVLLDLAPDRA